MKLPCAIDMASIFGGTIGGYDRFYLNQIDIKINQLDIIFESRPLRHLSLSI